MMENKIADSLIENDEDAGWLITYADLTTLLLVFFVLLYSISSIEHEKFKTTFKALKQNAEGNSCVSDYLETFDFPDYGNEQIALEELTGLRSREDSIVKDINRFTSQDNDSNEFDLLVSMGKIIIRVDGSYVFNSGSAELNKGFIIVLNNITRILDKYPEYNMNIKGHTDDVPIVSDRYPSNWELSAGRATAVLRHFIKNGIDPLRLTATGYGSILPIVPNNSDENRAKNRRVEFVLEKTTHQF